VKTSAIVRSSRRVSATPGKKEPPVKLKFVWIAITFLAASLVPPAFAQSTGADTFKAKCQMCHGPDGLGHTPAGRAVKIVSLKDPAVISAKDADLVAFIKKGKNKMPSFAGKLSDYQIESVVQYIRTLEK
jgi:cytochrome c6